MQNVLAGYSGTVWNTIYTALGYYYTQLQAAQSANNPAQAISISQAMLQSLLNAADAISCVDYSTAWQYQYTQLKAVSILPLSGPITPTDVAYFNARLQAYNFAYPVLSGLAPQAPYQTPAETLTVGQPIIPDPGLMTFFEDFAFETAPIGLTAATFASSASGVNTAFADVYTALQIYEGLYPTQLIDVIQMEVDATYLASYIINSFTSGPVASGSSQAWNQIVATPSMNAVATTIASAPYSQQAQQSGVIRNVMLFVARQIAIYLLTVQNPGSMTVDIATVLNNDTPMNMAARELGNFELWTEIVSLNNLMPPYFGPVAAAGIAAWGSKVILPTPGASKSAAGVSPSYNINILGTDIYIGPINGDMPTWTGDFQTITGYNNLAWALGRRLQTPQSSLIYDLNYGSRIPSEIGMIQTNSTVGQISAFGKASLLADPRVTAVVSSLAQLLVNQTVSYQGVVQPIGLHTRGLNVNEVITSAGHQS